MLVELLPFYGSELIVDVKGKARRNGTTAQVRIKIFTQNGENIGEDVTTFNTLGKRYLRSFREHHNELTVLLKIESI
mgnify:CR=1 FL=1